MTVLWPNGSSSPNPPTVTAEFGTYNPFGTGAYSHYGIDLIGWETIVAPYSGTVTFAGYNGAAGNEVRIKADNGDVYRMLHNRYIAVVAGQRVKQGQAVALMGATGQVTGVHCHFETRPGGGSPVNPRTYMGQKNANNQPAGNGSLSKPGPGKEPTIIGESEMLAIRLIAGPKKHLLTLSDAGILNHLAQSDNPERLMKIYRERDDWQDVDISELASFLESSGCDKNIWDIRNSKGQSVELNDKDAQFVVLDPRTGKVAGGQRWSAVDAARAEIRALDAKINKLLAKLDIK